MSGSVMTLHAGDGVSRKVSKRPLTGIQWAGGQAFDNRSQRFYGKMGYRHGLFFWVGLSNSTLPQVEAVSTY